MTRFSFKQVINKNVSKTTVEVEEVLSLAMNQGSFFHKNEVSWMKELINFLPTNGEPLNTIKFIQYIQNKKLKTHKKTAAFYFKIFEELGASYS